MRLSLEVVTRQSTSQVCLVSFTCYHATNAHGTFSQAGLETRALEINMVSLVSGRILKGTVMGNANPPDYISYLVELHAEAHLPFEKLDKEYNPEEINQAEADRLSGIAVKPLIAF